LKRKFLIGNIIISFIVFLSIFIIVIFDIVPATNPYNKITQLQVTKLVLYISGFAFFLTLLREIIKDFEDRLGDQQINSKTLPIVLGESNSKKIIVILGTFSIVAIDYFAFSLYFGNMYAAIYIALFVGLPLLYFLLKVKKAKTKNDYHRLSTLLKIIMLLGVLSTLFL
jgi:4-hydroxybenzoate polyprenyltransferase